MYTIKDLYDLEHTLAKEYLSRFTYPWEALAGIKEFILQLGPSTARGWSTNGATRRPRCSPRPISARHASSVTEVRHCALPGIDTTGLLQAVDTAVEMVRNEPNGGAVPVPDYMNENVSDKVAKIIQSYVGVINKMVWRKS